MKSLIGLLFLAQANPADVAELAKKIEFFDFTKITVALVVTLIAYFANRLLGSLLDRMGEGHAKRRLLFKKVQSFMKLGIFILASYLVVITFFGGDEDNKALIGLGGTLAVAIGFALKDTASSLMAGVLVLIDQPFQVGDRVQFGSTYGEVKEIGLRSVRIVTLDDNEVSIPNNKFLTESVASANSGALDMMVVIKFHIAMTEDFDLAKKLVFEACITSRYVFLHKPVVILLKEEVTQIAFSTVISCKAYVIDTRYEMAFVSDVTERVKRAFRVHGIQSPYHREYSVKASSWDELSPPINADEIFDEEDQIGSKLWRERAETSEAPEREEVAMLKLAREVIHRTQMDVDALDDEDSEVDIVPEVSPGKVQGLGSDTSDYVHDPAGSTDEPQDAQGVMAHLRRSAEMERVLLDELLDESAFNDVGEDSVEPDTKDVDAEHAEGALQAASSAEPEEAASRPLNTDHDTPEPEEG